ncbi:tonin-like [Tubulanus polymorphus]|uniref:tonin-like n=1 Tax=Tubulanus polymorphus TaxID=672921 RepID=UPI003DA3F8E4
MNLLITVVIFAAEFLAPSVQDVAVIRIAGDGLPVGDPGASAVNLPDNNNDLGNDAVCTASGWGFTDGSAVNETGYSNDLMKTNLKPVSLQICENYYEDKFPEFNSTDLHLCIEGDDGKDTCSGDSGGPLTCLDGDREVLRVYGVYFIVKQAVNFENAR